MRTSKLNLLILAKVFILVASCSESEFSGGNAKPAKKADAPAVVETPKPIIGDPPVVPDQPLTIDPGGKASIPDYGLCNNLPTGGYASSGACGANEVMVIINDGKASGRTCCPVGDGVLSKVPAEVNQKRTGVCGPDEVATGIEGMTTPFCTKINTQFFTLQPAGKSVYGARRSSGLLGQLAEKYNRGDCCSCPEGTVMIGDHSLGDNSCQDSCVRIVSKAK